jgi:hypothetical protein
VVGDLAYLANPLTYANLLDPRIDILDVRNPAQPRWRYSYRRVRSPAALQIVGVVGYIAYREDGLQIVGLHPELLSEVFLPLALSEEEVGAFDAP